MVVSSTHLAGATLLYSTPDPRRGKRNKKEELYNPVASPEQGEQ